MLGLFKSQEPLEINKGDIFKAETTKITHHGLMDSKEVTPREVIILDNKLNSSSVLVSSVIKTSRRIMDHDIGDLMRINKSDLRKKVGEVSEFALESLQQYIQNGNFESIPIEY